MCDLIWSHYLHLERSLRMRRVTWPITGGKNDPHFWNPWTQFTYWLCHFYGATTKIKPCYRRKQRFPIVNATKLTAHAQYHVTCAQGVPQFNPHVPIFWPRSNCLFTIQLLWGYDDDWGYSFILIEHPHMLKRFSAAKKRKSSQNRSPKWRFSEI